MAIIATDLLVKTMLEAGLADMRKNSWILDDVFSGLAVDPLSKAEYGWKEAKKARDWFLSNNVSVYLPYRIDAPNIPCLTVFGPQSGEMDARANLSDDGADESIVPTQSTAQPQRVYDPFTPAAYDPATGYVTFPQGINTDSLSPGMFLVSQKTGKAYVVTSLISSTSFAIAIGINDDFTNAYIAPVTQVWNLRREILYFDQSFTIACFTQGDPNKAIWLRDLTVYILGRYREAYLEARGFGISRINYGPPQIDPEFDSERTYRSDVTLTGQIQGDWIKYIAPKIQNVRSGILIADGPKTPTAYLAQAEAQGWKMQADETALIPEPNPGNIPQSGKIKPPDKSPTPPNETDDDQ